MFVKHFASSIQSAISLALYNSIRSSFKTNPFFRASNSISMTSLLSRKLLLRLEQKNVSDERGNLSSPRKRTATKGKETSLPLSLLHSMAPTHEQTCERQNKVCVWIYEAGLTIKKYYASVNIWTTMLTNKLELRVCS